MIKCNISFEDPSVNLFYTIRNFKDFARFLIHITQHSQIIIAKFNLVQADQIIEIPVSS